MKVVTQTVAPCLMQTAFRFPNGVHALFGTSESTGLSVFACDVNFEPLDKRNPYHRVAREHMSRWPTMLEYHKWLRAQHPEAQFVKEHSTDIDNLPTVNVVVS